MKLRKLGKIFDPTDYKLPNQCEQFAQSPQTLIFDDFIRIYFSTRAIDKSNGKYMSHIAFVDMCKSLRNIIRVSEKSVISLGNLGCFDEHGIFPINVLRHAGLVYGYYCGWSRRKSVSIDMSIGLAISHDEGLTFQRIGDGPVLTASSHEPYLVGDGFVKIINGKFHMWHIFGIGWKRFTPNDPPERIYKIGYSSSNDGINWEKDEGRQIIADRLGPDESQALPSVLKIGNFYHMFFCYRESFDFRTNKHRGYRIGHARSEDMLHWTRDDPYLYSDSNTGEWDSDMQCYPHVFECDGKVYLLYNGNEFGRFGFGVALLEEERK